VAERTSYTPGTFCWADLTTPDQERAKGFYSALFGWTADDRPVGEGAYYSMQSIDGRDVAAISPQPEQQRAAAAPPTWNSYIAVEDADATLERARKLGAEVHADAFDVLDSGRMGVIRDPQGAHVAVWQAGAHIGAQLVNAHGALSWNELYTSDIEASARFYSELFGWRTEAMEGMPMPYRTVQTSAGRGNGGITTMEGVPNAWLVYFGTDDIERSVAQAGELGGETRMGPMDIGVGSIAVVTDPQGATFALFAGTFED
jgi:predicted enzyme related to lactoylglutathione lyase